MKIVHLAETLEVGGAEKLVASLCRWQREQGQDVSVQCLYRVGWLGEELRKEKFDILLHEPGGKADWIASIYRELKRLKPDVLHCHNATAAILGAIPARAAGVKRIVVTRHGGIARPYAIRKELKFTLAARWCDWIVAVCEEARRNLIAAPFSTRRKIVRIYNAVCAPRPTGAELPVKSGFTLLTVARLSPAKDQQTLLRAVAIAKARVTDLQLWIVGDGSLRTELQALAQQIGLNGSVTFFGEKADVAPFLESADLFTLSSVTEGLPLSLLEAMAAGVPSIVTKVGGMTEVANLSAATVAVPASNPIALADAIEIMAQSRDQLPFLGTVARQCHAANFTFDRMAKEYAALYAN